MAPAAEKASQGGGGDIKPGSAAQNAEVGNFQALHFRRMAAEPEKRFSNKNQSPEADGSEESKPDTLPQTGPNPVVCPSSGILGNKHVDIPGDPQEKCDKQKCGDPGRYDGCNRLQRMVRQENPVGELHDRRGRHAHGGQF